MLIKRGVLAEPVVARLEEVVCGSEVYPDCLLGEYLCIPSLCVRADSMLPVLFCAKANLQKMLKACACHVAAVPWNVARPTYVGGSI